MKNVPFLGSLAVLFFGVSLFTVTLPLTAGFEDVAGEEEVPAAPATPAPATPAPTKQTQAKAPVAPAPTKQTQAKASTAATPAPVAPATPAPVMPAPTKQTQVKTPTPATPAPATPAVTAPAAPKVVDIKTLKFSRTISGFGYKKWNADMPTVENNIKAAMKVVLPIIDKIKAHPEGYKYKIMIVGHTDGVGPEDPKGDKPGNVEISRERAQGVLDYIVQNYNVSRDMFEIQAKGSSQLKNSSSPRAAENRRVVIVFAP